MDSVIVRYSEINLKGKNRIIFENYLVNNIKECLEKENIEFDSVQRLRNRIIIKTKQDCGVLKRVFGVASFSHGIEVKSDLGEIKQKSGELIAGLNEKKSFRVSCQRLDKQVPLSSMEIEKELGSFVAEKTNAKVDLKNFDFELGVEIVNGVVFLFVKKEKCFGGLPIGSQGNVICVIDDEKSILAALLMMKRGCFISPFSFSNKDMGLIRKFSYGHFPELKIIKHLKDAEFFAIEKNARALVIGQTPDDYEELGLEMPVLRPLIGYSDEEIEEKLNEFKKVC